MELSTLIALMLIAISAILVVRHYRWAERYSGDIFVKELSLMILILIGSVAIDFLAFNGDVLLKPLIGGGTLDYLLALNNNASSKGVLVTIYTVILIIIPLSGMLFFLKKRETPQ